MRNINGLLALVLGLSVNSAIVAGEAQDKVYPVAIIGAGAGGTMAAKRVTLNNREVLLFTGAKKEMKRSRGHWVRTVDNVPGLEKYKRTIVDLRKEVLKELEKSPLGHNLHVVNNSVASIKKSGDHFTLRDKAGNSYQAKHVIVATGMMDEQPHINKSIRPILPYANKQLIAYCVLCDGHRAYKKNTAVIGYSEEAAIAAIVLHDRYHPPLLTLVTNGHAPQFSPETAKLLQDKQIKVAQEPIKSILGNKKKKQLDGFELRSGERVNAQIGFVLLGVRPNNNLALELGANVDDKGLVITDANGETNVANLYVIGDLRSGSLKQIYTAWHHAVDTAQLIDRRLRQQQ